MDTPRTTVKLMRDYSCVWPLWRGGRIEPEDLSLSPALTADLAAWQELFDLEFHWDTGWRAREAEAEYARSGVDLWYRLRRELGPEVDVELDLWPVVDERFRAWLKHRT